ncbi:MAG: hypothetical protein ACRC54_04965 [Fusobacteriaceae bacterium]
MYNFPDNLVVNQVFSVPLSENINNFNFYLIVITDGGRDTDAHWTAFFPSNYRISCRAPSDSLSDSTDSKYYDLIGIKIEDSGNNLNLSLYRIVNPTKLFDPNNYISVYGVGRK